MGEGEKASPPTPLRVERGVISEIPLLFGTFLSKQFPALPLSEGEGVGGEAFFRFIRHFE